MNQPLSILFGTFRNIIEFDKENIARIYNPMRPLKICYISHSIESIHTQKWVKYFVNKGHDVSVILSNDAKFNGIKTYNFNKKVIPLADVPYLRIVNKIINVRKILSNIRPDVLHVHWALGCGWIGNISGYRPKILTVWGGDVTPKQWSRNHLYVNWLMNKVFLSKYEIYTYHSPHLKKLLRSYVGDDKRMEHIEFGVDTGLFNTVSRQEKLDLKKRHGYRENDFVIFAPGDIIPLQNTHLILKAIKILHDELDNIRLIIKTRPGCWCWNNVNDKRYYDGIVDSIARKKMDSFVSIHGRVSVNTMIELYKMSDAVVLIPDADGKSLSIIEAMACGIPVIGSRIDAYEDFLINGKNALLVDLHEEGIVQAIRKLRDDNLLIGKLVENAYHDVVRRCDYNDAMGRMESIYYEMAGCADN